MTRTSKSVVHHWVTTMAANDQTRGGWHTKHADRSPRTSVKPREDEVGAQDTIGTYISECIFLKNKDAIL
jgi:hypothetical protein